MNVFKLQGNGITDVSTQLTRLAPFGSKICVVEIDEGDDRVIFARDVAQLIATARNTTFVERTAQGYQLGVSEANRTTLYRMFFLE